MSAPRYDSIVVGGGPNGLAAAITLAERGRGVLLVEAQPQLGGAVATEELTLPGFRHDVFSAVHPAAVASPAFAAMELERHGLRWIHPELPMAHPLPDGRAAVLARDVGETAASLDALAPGDGGRWDGLVAPLLRRFRAVRGVMLGGFPPLASGARLVAGLGVGGTLELTRLLLASAEALAAELFRGEGAAWLLGTALHGDAPLDGAGSGISALYLSLLGHASGWPSPQGGAGRLIDALAGRFAELGGVARCGVAVVALHAAHGRVTGVGLADGTRADAPIVVCDTTPHELVRLAGAAAGTAAGAGIGTAVGAREVAHAGAVLPDAYVRKLLRFRYGPATLKLDWALDAPIPWTAPQARRAGTVHVGGTAQEIRRAQRALATGELPPAPLLLVGQQSLADPTRAPAGKQTAWAYTHVPADVDREAGADAIEAQVERFAPGFRDRVLARHVLGPADLEQRDANLVRGDVGGGSYALDQLVFRPVPSLNPYATPLEGLFLGSASTFPGGGVHGVPGRAAAKAALRTERVRSAARRARSPRRRGS